LLHMVAHFSILIPVALAISVAPLMTKSFSDLNPAFCRQILVAGPMSSRTLRSSSEESALLLPNPAYYNYQLTT
jgi:hypothetical protein